MARRSYGQICGLSHALEVLGERWALLIIRDLLVSPKRFTDLRQGLPRIPTNVLSARLKELEEAGVLHRRVLPRPANAVVYELTQYGQQLEDIVLALGRWGAQNMRPTEPEDIVTTDSLIMAMRSTYHPDSDSPEPLNYQLRVADVVISIALEDGQLRTTEGATPDPDLVIETGTGLAGLLTAKVTPEQAIANGDVQLTGDPQLLTHFANTFHL
jgi:DNA-binding HxlR family transcriptional regulator